jgi:hypothetical protein
MKNVLKMIINLLVVFSFIYDTLSFSILDIATCKLPQQKILQKI